MTASAALKYSKYVSRGKLKPNIECLAIHGVSVFTCFVIFDCIYYKLLFIYLLNIVYENLIS